MMSRPYWILFLILLLPLTQGWASDQHKLIRRLAVFPIFSADHELGEQAQDAWWDFRENLVKDGFFFVASRRLMVNRGVFAPHRALTRADAILLAKTVEAQAVVTMEVEAKKLLLRAYDGRNGQPLVTLEQDLYPATPIPMQLQRVASVLARSLREIWPYEAFQVIQEEGLLRRESGARIAKIYIGRETELAPGDEVQWITLPAVHTDALFQSPELISRPVQGRLQSKVGEYAFVELAKGANEAFLFEGALVHLPGAQFGYSESMVAEQLTAKYGSERDPEVLAAEIKQQKQSAATTGLAFLAGIAAFILIAF